MLVSKIDRIAPRPEPPRRQVQRELIEARDIQEAARIVQHLYPHCIVTQDARVAVR